MFVLNELKKSVVILDEMAKSLDNIDNLTDLDRFEPELQSVVFNLQMQANQVAGELVPQVTKRRQDLQQGNVQAVLASIRALKEELSERVKEKEDVNSDNDIISDIADSGSTELESELPASGQPGYTKGEHAEQTVKDGNPDPTDAKQVPVQDLSQKETEVKG